MKQNLLTKSILTLVMLVMSVTAWADYGDVIKDNIMYRYNTDTHTAYVTSGPIDYSGNIEVLSTFTIDGVEYTVTSISHNAFENSDVETVKLPSTVTSIYSEAFKGCKKLTSIDLGNSVTTIDIFAFDGCVNLTSVTGCESVEYVGVKAFRKVPWVENQPDGVVYIGKSLYKYNGFMPTNTSIVIKEGTSQVCYEAFRNFTHLVAVTFPNTITRIEDYAFFECTELSTISIPLSAMVSYVDQDAFTETKWLEDQPNGVVYWGNVLYTIKVYLKDETLNIKDGTTAIAAEALSRGTRNVTSVNLPNSLIAICERAFKNSYITSITIPNSIETINFDTFNGCGNLQKVILPPNIKEIWSGAFARTNIKELICLSEIVPKTDDSAFRYVKLEDATLYVPKSALEDYKSTKPWSSFGTIKAVEEMDDAVAPTISNKTVTVKNVEYSSVELSWNKAIDNFTPKDELLYSVYVNGKLFKQGRDMDGCIVTDLKPSTSYTFEVRVEDLRGNVSKYNTVQATTEAKPVVIEKYPVFIEGQQLTSENANDFWGDGGTVKYDPATKTLTLSWADLYSSSETLVLDDETTISLIGVNQIGGAIYANTGKMVTIKADDRYGDNSSLIVKGSMYGRCELTIEGGCSVEIDATGKGTSGLKLDDSLLLIDKSALKVKGDGTKPSIFDITTFVLEGSQFESNHHYEWEGSMFVDAKGKEATDEIIIAPIIKKTPMIADNSITIVNVDDTSATVAWMAATDDTTPQSELTYSIYSMKYGSSDFTGDAHQKGMTSYTYTNLQPGTTYYVRVKVVDKDDNQVFYQDASFTTTTPDTSAPALSDDEIRVTNVTENSIAIEWTKASDDRTAGDQLVYEVVYADNSSFADNYLMVQVDKNTATLRNLTPSTIYYIKVSVRDEASNQSEYRVLSVTTNAPSAINEVTAESGDEKMYSTSGVRVSENFRGVVIKNGKKYINK